MSATQKSYLWKSMLFAVLVDAVFLLVTCLLFGLPHASLTTTMTPKAPITVGFSSVVELLNLSALFDAGPLMILLLGLCVTFLYPLLNACYISLLARSVRDFWDSPFQNARRSYGTLLVWMFVQYLAQFLVLLLPLVGKSIGSALAVALLLRFRYIYLFFELMAVAFGKKFKATWTGSNALRRQVKWKLAPFYWIILLFNLSLYYVVNNYFSWTVLIGAIVVSSVLMTLIQRSLLQLYFRAQDKAYPASETGVLSL